MEAYPMILQRDKRLLPEIQEQGCYFMSILFLINKYTNYEWTTEIINDYYRSLVYSKAILADADFTTVDVDDSTIINPEKVFNLKETGTNFKVRYNNRHDKANYHCSQFEIEILRYVNGLTNHFVAGNGNGEVAYDPWGDSMTVKNGYLESKRIFRRLV
jgi:hypothetical protein